MARGAGTDEPMSLRDLVALDFLLQHPSIFAPFVGRSAGLKNGGILPAVSERESSEEALLRWKRAVGPAVVTPMLGRHIARGLIRHDGLGLRLTQRGAAIAHRFSEVMDVHMTERIDFATEVFRRDASDAHRRLREALAARAEQ
jgi:hypothetical protein